MPPPGVALVGLEPGVSTVKLRHWHSTDWASGASKKTSTKIPPTGLPSEMLYTTHRHRDIVVVSTAGLEVFDDDTATAPTALIKWESECLIAKKLWQDLIYDKEVRQWSFIHLQKCSMLLVQDQLSKAGCAVLVLWEYFRKIFSFKITYFFQTELMGFLSIKTSSKICLPVLYMPKVKFLNNLK